MKHRFTQSRFSGHNQGFRALKAAGGKKAELYIYDEIGPAWLGMIDDTVVIDALKGVGDVDVRVNSPGGDVFAGVSIFNALRRHEGEVTVHVDGLAASAASLFTLAGDKSFIADNAMVMVHKAWSFAVGNADDMRDMAGWIAEKVSSVASSHSRCLNCCAR